MEGINPKPSVSVVIPVYNSRETLSDLVERLQKVFSLAGIDHEIILVNDGSPDDSWQTIKKLVREQKQVKGMNLMRNYGQHNALLAGIRAANFELIVTLDDDLQNPPEEIPALLAKLSEGYDVVYGAPRKERHGFLRDLASRVTKMVLQKNMGVENARKVSAFRAFRTELREAFKDFQGPYLTIDVLLTWATKNFSYIEVKHENRKHGNSNYTFFMLVTYAFNMITGFSVIPLQIASLVGFCCTFFGMLILAFVLIRYLIEGSPVQGFPFLASIIAIFSGAQLFATGMIGEYIARMHFRIMDKPTYAVRETLDT